MVVAQSPVLFKALAASEEMSFRVDERISQEVWRSVLQFMYQGRS